MHGNILGIKALKPLYPHRIHPFFLTVVLQLTTGVQNDNGNQ